MAVQLNHTVVHSQNKQESAEFLARILGIGPPGTFGHFVTVEVANGVSLDFDDAKDVRSRALRLPRRRRGVRSDLRARRARRGRSCTTPTRCTSSRARSTPATPDAASTSTVRKATTSR